MNMPITTDTPSQPCVIVFELLGHMHTHIYKKTRSFEQFTLLSAADGVHTLSEENQRIKLKLGEKKE
jgi:hypothetical protein